MSQNHAILADLQAGHTITPLDALRRYGCMRLAARVADLRSSGHRIKTVRRRLPNGKQVAEYQLEPSNG